MSSVNDNPNHFMVLDAISRGMKQMGKLAEDMRLGKVLVETVVNRRVSQLLAVIAEKKGFFGGEKERNND